MIKKHGILLIVRSSVIKSIYFRPNIYSTAASNIYLEQAPQNCEPSELKNYDDQNIKEESIKYEQESVFNNSASNTSVSDSEEDKYEESAPQDLSMISYRENKNKL